MKAELIKFPVKTWYALTVAEPLLLATGLEVADTPPMSLANTPCGANNNIPRSLDITGFTAIG